MDLDQTSSRTGLVLASADQGAMSERPLTQLGATSSMVSTSSMAMSATSSVGRDDLEAPPEAAAEPRRPRTAAAAFEVEAGGDINPAGGRPPLPMRMVSSAPADWPEPEPEPEPEEGEPPSALWLAAGEQVRQLSNQSRETDELASQTSAELGSQTSAERLAEHIDGMAPGRRSMTYVVSLAEQLRSGAAEPSAKTASLLVSNLNPVHSSDADRSSILRAASELVRRGHSSLLLSAGFAQIALDMLESSCGDARTQGSLLAGQVPGELLYLLQLWMRTEPGHWAGILREEHVSLLCSLATWRPLLPDNLSQMLHNDVHAGLALHCLRAICVDVKTLKESDADEHVLMLLGPRSPGGKLGGTEIRGLIEGAEGSEDGLREPELLLEYSEAVANHRNEPPDRALLGEPLWAAESPELRIAKEGEEIDTEDKSCLQTSERALSSCMRWPGFCCLGLPFSMCTLAYFRCDRSARDRWTKRRLATGLAKRLSAMLKKCGPRCKSSPEMVWGAGLAHIVVSAFHWWLIVWAWWDSEFMLGHSAEHWDVANHGIFAFFVLFIISRVFWTIACGGEAACISCHENSSNETSAGAVQGALDWVGWFLQIPMLCFACRPDQEAGQRTATTIPMAFAALQDLFLTPLATAITIMNGRLNLHNNPNPALGLVVACALIFSWVFWASFAVLDPVATRFGFHTDNPKAQWSALIFVTRLFEVSSRTLFLGCVMAGYGPLVIPMIIAEWIIIQTPQAFLADERREPPLCAFTQLMCWSATICDARDSQTTPGISNFASRGWAWHSSIRMAELIALLCLWSQGLPGLFFDGNYCIHANDGICDEVAIIQNRCHEEPSATTGHRMCSPGTDRADCTNFSLPDPPPPPPPAYMYTESTWDVSPSWLAPDSEGTFRLSGSADQGWATVFGLSCSDSDFSSGTHTVEEAVETCEATAGCLGVEDLTCSGASLRLCKERDAEGLLELNPNRLTDTTAHCVHVPPNATVAVVRPASRGALVSQGKPATQSSHYSSSSTARKAVDGDTDGSFDSGTCTHTGDSLALGEWWQVDLGSPMPINHVDVYHRTDCCEERAVGARIIISSGSDFRSAERGTGGTSAECGSLAERGGSPEQVSCGGLEGQFVTVDLGTKPGTPLTLCEVQVFAELGPNSTTADGRSKLGLWGDDNPIDRDAYPSGGGRCQGECDSDDDCQGHLQCYQRSDYEDVPGCINNHDEDNRGSWDYCYDPLASFEPESLVNSTPALYKRGATQYSYHPIILEAGIERLIRRDHWNQLRHEVSALSSQIDELASRDDYAIYARVLNASATRAQTAALFDLAAQLDRFAASDSFADYTGGLGQSPHPFPQMNLTRRWAVLPFTQCNVVGEGPFNSFAAAGEACTRNESSCSGVVAWDGCTGDGPFFTCGKVPEHCSDEAASATQSPAGVELRGEDMNDPGSGGLCEGDCDGDDDCPGSMLCFERDDYEQVPGCIGQGRSGMDYCYEDDPCRFSNAWSALRDGPFMTVAIESYSSHNCQSHGSCRALGDDKYCDSSNSCYGCDYVRDNSCDAFDDDCSVCYNPPPPPPTPNVAVCMYVEPETIFFVEHWATSHGSCPAICSEPLAESCTFYLADQLRDHQDDMRFPLLFSVFAGAMAYGVLGLLLHCAHINDSFGFVDRRHSEEGWKNFLRTAANKGIKGAPKELVDALAAGEDADYEGLRTTTKFKVRQRLLKEHVASDEGFIFFSVDRENLFENVVVQLRVLDDSELRPTRIRVRFEGEPGIDMGGLRRDLFTLFGQGMAKWGTEARPMERLVKSAGRQNRFMPEPCAVEVHGIEEARDMYRAIGRFCAIAVKTEHLVDFSFADFFWRRVMQEEVSLEQNLADLDREGEEDFARSMRTILNTPLKELEMTDGDFNLTRNLSSSGEVGIRDQTVDLVLGGADIELTDENKEEYVTALLDHKLGASISLAAEGFRQGLQDVLGPFILRLFSAEECQMLLGGEQGVNDKALAQWKTHTRYSGQFSADHDVILWFWEVLEAGTPEFRSQVLWFQSGSARVPPGGFKSTERGYKIKPLSGQSDGLPVAHTCFYQIDLPIYTEKEQLKRMLEWAADSAGNAYGMA